MNGRANRKFVKNLPIIITIFGYFGSLSFSATSNYRKTTHVMPIFEMNSHNLEPRAQFHDPKSKFYQHHRIWPRITGIPKMHIFISGQSLQFLVPCSAPWTQIEILSPQFIRNRSIDKSSYLAPSLSSKTLELKARSKLSYWDWKAKIIFVTASNLSTFNCFFFFPPSFKLLELTLVNFLNFQFIYC